jgi:CBS domain-containing protein
MAGQLISLKGELLVADDKKVKDLMIPLEDYPHIPYWFSLRQAMAILQEASIKFETTFEPRTVLVFDEKYQLLGILTLRDIIQGLEPRFLHETSLIKSDPSLVLLTEGFRSAGLQEAAQQQVSEVMSPIKVTVDGDSPIPKALFLMIKENVGMMPVILDNKVVGMIRLSDLYKEVSKIILGN